MGARLTVVLGVGLLSCLELASCTSTTENDPQHTGGGGGTGALDGGSGAGGASGGGGTTSGGGGPSGGGAPSGGGGGPSSGGGATAGGGAPSGGGGAPTGGGGGPTGGGGAPTGGGGGPTGGGGAPTGGGGAPTGGGGAPSGGGSTAVDCSCTGAPKVDAGGSGCVRCIDAIYVNLPVTDPQLCAGEVSMYKTLRDCVCQSCGGTGKLCAQQLCPPATFDGNCEGCMITSCKAAYDACNK